MGVPTKGNFVVLPVHIQEAGERGGVENLLAEPLPGGIFRLVLTPGFVCGYAAEDLVRYESTTRTLELVERGMKVGVQFFHPHLEERVVNHIEDQVRSVGGSIDGRLDQLLVLTFPVSVRVKNIQNFLRQYENEFGVEWEFVNLFSSDGDPLEWWKAYV